MTAVYEGPDNVSGEILKILNGFISNYSAVQSRIAAAEGDRDKAIQTWIENTDHDKAVKLREAIKRANTQLRELAETEVKSETLSDEEKRTLKTELAELGTQIRNGRNAVEMVANSVSQDKEAVLKVLDELGDPTKSRIGRPKGSTGSSVPRVSANVYLKSTAGDPDSDPEEFENFGKASARLGISVEEFGQAFAKAAGVAYENISKVDKVMEFEYKPANASVPWKIRTEPKERQKPGPKGNK